MSLVIKYCQVCQGSLRQFLDLGSHPPTSVLAHSRSDGPKTLYPLVIFRCDSCGLVQSGYATDPKLLFGGEEYFYWSSATASFRKHLEDLADYLMAKFKPKFVVDIGGNDGRALKKYEEAGVKVLNVDPSSVATKAMVLTLNDFFNERTAEEIVKKKGQADLITAYNVFAHTPLQETMNGIDRLLKPDGVFVSESQYLMDNISELAYDTCLTPKQKVVTISGLKDIEKVEVGEYVLTHLGNFKRVINRFERKYSGEVIKIKIWGQTDPLIVTPEHPIYAKIRWEDRKRGRPRLPHFIEARDLRMGSVLVKPRIKESKPNQTITIVENFRRGHASKKTSFFIDKTLAKIIGYYLAEGHFSKHGRNFSQATFSFGKSEPEKNLAQDCLDSIHTLGGSGSIHYTKFGWRVITSGTMAKLLMQECGTGAENKHLPSWAYSSEVAIANSVLIHYMKGDGYVYRDGKYLRGGSVSGDIAQGMALLANKLGYTVSICRQEPSKPKIIANNPKPTLNAKPCYDILVRVVKRQLKGKVWIEDDYQFTKIRSIKRENYVGHVYNLEVEDDDSYVTIQSAVHNCYLEHLRYYSLHTMISLLARWDFKVFKAERVVGIGSSIRVFACRAKKTIESDTSVNNILKLEDDFGLQNLKTYTGFANRVKQSKIDLNTLLWKLKREGNRIAGIGVAGRSTTIMNYCMLGPDLIDYLAETNPLKIGCFSAGMEIPIMSEDYFMDNQPDYAVNFLWHLPQIVPRLRARGFKGHFIVPLPKVEVI